MRKLLLQISGLKNMVCEMKTSLESLTSKVTTSEERIGELENELHNTFIQQKRMKRSPKIH